MIAPLSLILMAFMAGDHSSAQTHLPQKIHFPDSVEKTRLKAVGTEDQRSIEHGVQNKKETFFGAVFTNKRLETQDHQVYFDENTPFHLTLEAGNRFAITDPDATDGHAIIQLPQGVFKMYVQVQDQKQKPAHLGVFDPLYHVKDTLNGSQGGSWMLLGARPFPLPQEWHSDDGQKLVLHLQPKDLSTFQMRWLNTYEKAPFPPGINEVGPQGGIVKLPGVATLTIPDGALDKNTVISMKQVASAYEPGAVHLNAGAVNEVIQKNFYSYASAIVELQPHGLHFDRPAKVKLKNTTSWKHHSTIIEVLSMKNKPEIVTSREQGSRLKEELELLILATDIDFNNLNQITVPIDDFEYYIEHFSYIAKVFPSFLASSKSNESL